MAAAPTGPQSTRNRCVFVGNIPYDATEEQLIQICEEVGPVVSFRLVLDKETGKPKGYGFCEYKDDETALSARRNLQGYEINGRQLRVDFAENGKNADRNREQGRGGPGMASTVDVQKQLGGTSILRDSSLHQPIGLQPAIHAASVMAGALGGAQTAIVQNGLPVQYGLGNDPLTHYLARMSKHQLHEVMSELKSLATQNKELAKKLLQGIPQLPKALFQAQIMVGMTPQMMQMAKSQQTPSSFVQSSSHPSMTFPRPDATMQMLPRPPVSLPVNIPQNSAVPQESTVPVPQYQHPSHSQAKMFSHGHHSGVVTYPPVPSQPLGVPSSLPSQPLLTLRGSTSQVQSTFQPQHFEPPVVPTSVQQPLLPYAHLPQANSINAPFLVAAAHETLPKEVRLPGQANMLSHLPDSSHPSKLRKLDIGTSVPGMVNNDPAIYSTPSQAVISDGPSGSQRVGAITIQQPEKEMTPQLPPEVESSLLQQVLQLTQEQLSALPVEQRQQVIELQRMLSAGK